MAVWFDARGSLYVITVNDSVTSRRLVPLQQEILSIVYPDIQCPVSDDLFSLFTD